jgi:hypothetical protein
LTPRRTPELAVRHPAHQHPSFIAGILAWVFNKKTTAPAVVHPAVPHESTAALLSGLKNWKILVGVVISIFNMAGLWTFASFVPPYLTGVSRLPVANKGLFMSVFEASPRRKQTNPAAPRQRSKPVDGTSRAGRSGPSFAAWPGRPT